MSVAPIRPSTTSELVDAKLADPRVSEALLVLLDHLDLVAVLLQGTSDLVARGDTITDSVVEGLREVSGPAGETLSSVDLASVIAAGQQLMSVVPRAAPVISEAIDNGVLDRLLDSGLMSRSTLEQMTVVATGLTRGAREFETAPVSVGGPWSLLGLLRDPDINRSLSYFATIAKAIGQTLDSSQSSSRRD